jgi:hypothetical protein
MRCSHNLVGLKRGKVKGCGGAGTRSEPGWSSIVVYHWFALPIAHIPEDEKVIFMQAL